MKKIIAVLLIATMGCGIAAYAARIPAPAKADPDRAKGSGEQPR